MRKLKVLFVNELSPNDVRIGAFRMRELSAAMARQGHSIILFTTAANNETITDLSKLSSVIDQHNFSHPLHICCGRKKSFLQPRIRKGQLPKLLNKILIFCYYFFSIGVTRDWKQGSKPFWRPLAKIFSPDVVIGTFGNTDCLMITKKIAHYANAPWVIDMKDSWNNFVPALFRRYTAEKFKDTALITVLAEFYLKDAAEFFPEIPRCVIYSGFPSYLLEKNTHKKEVGKYKIFLVGSHYNKIHLRILLNGIQQWAEKQSDFVELHYLGSDHEVIDNEFAAIAGNLHTVNHGQVTFETYIDFLQQADVLCYVHLDVTFHHKSTELLAFQKPIICVPFEHSEAIKLAENAKIPLFQCRDSHAVISALQTCFASEDPLIINKEFLRLFTWDAQALQLTGYCTRLIAGKPLTVEKCKLI